MKLEQVNHVKVKKVTFLLGKNFPDDLNDDLAEKCLQFKKLLRTTTLSRKNTQFAKTILEIINRNHSFSNVCTALKKFLDIAHYEGGWNRSF